MRSSPKCPAAIRRNPASSMRRSSAIAPEPPSRLRPSGWPKRCVSSTKRGSTDWSRICLRCARFSPMRSATRTPARSPRCAMRCAKNSTGSSSSCACPTTSSRRATSRRRRCVRRSSACCTMPAPRAAFRPNRRPPASFCAAATNPSKFRNFAERLARLRTCKRAAVGGAGAPASRREPTARALSCAARRTARRAGGIGFRRVHGRAAAQARRRARRCPRRRAHVAARGRVDARARHHHRGRRGRGRRGRTRSSRRAAKPSTSARPSARRSRRKPDGPTPPA